MSQTESGSPRLDARLWRIMLALFLAGFATFSLI